MPGMLLWLHTVHEKELWPLGNAATDISLAQYGLIENELLWPLGLRWVDAPFGNVVCLYESIVATQRCAHHSARQCIARVGSEKNA